MSVFAVSLKKEKKSMAKAGMKVHSCKPSYLGGIDKMITKSDQPEQT
jgi:hypothetical protein